MFSRNTVQSTSLADSISKRIISNMELIGLFNKEYIHKSQPDLNYLKIRRSSMILSSSQDLCIACSFNICDIFHLECLDVDILLHNICFCVINDFIKNIQENLSRNEIYLNRSSSDTF